MKKILVLCIACLMLAGTAMAQDQIAEKEVVRATFATGVENREPVESIDSYNPVEGGMVCFFTELKNMTDSQVYHVWSKNGEEIYKFTTNVGGPRWRTFSSMKSEHFKAGDEITVKVIDSEGTEFKNATLSIQ